MVEFASWNGFLAVLFASVFLYATISVPHFASTFNLSQAAAGVSEKAILLLPMAMLIIAREIDLSVASILALTSVVLGILIRAHVPLVGGDSNSARGGRGGRGAERSPGHRSQSAFAAGDLGHHGLVSRDRLHHAGNAFSQ